MHPTSGTAEVAEAPEDPVGEPLSAPGFPAGHWYSPNVDPAEVAGRAAQIWPDQPTAAGIDFRHDHQESLLRGPFQECEALYHPLLEASANGPAPYREPNDFFMGLDSRALVVMLHVHEPSRVLEVGSGHSTRLLAAAAQHLPGAHFKLETIDPHASEALRDGLTGLDHLLAVAVQDTDPALFTSLRSNDILFIDSSHVAKTGSDVEFLLGQVLPLLAPGVVVHFHDIFLPFDYPYEWVVEQRRDWNEQYLLQALLARPTRYEILFGSRYASWALADEVRSAVGSGVATGQSLWVRVTDHENRTSRWTTRRSRQKQERTDRAETKVETHRASVAYDPDLVPPIDLMRHEGIDVLEEWFRWGEEWSMLLRLFGRLDPTSHVLEIGCGLGRTAFPLRYLLDERGSYRGFDIVRRKIEFLQRFTRRYPSFRFDHVDLNNTYYNPSGTVDPTDFVFPYADAAFDLVYAASVFTHLLPCHAAQYLAEAARVVRPSGRIIVSAFLLDFYRPGTPRPHGFNRSAFDFDHTFEDSTGFAIGNPLNPEEMTAYESELLILMAASSGLELAEAPRAGSWSGRSGPTVGAQDLLVFTPRKTDSTLD